MRTILKPQVEIIVSGVKSAEKVSIKKFLPPVFARQIGQSWVREVKQVDYLSEQLLVQKYQPTLPTRRIDLSD